jgi:DNA-binding SARP family transcriptional activator
VTRVRLLGTPGIEATSGERVTVRGQKPWALLARLVLAERPISRRQLALELFPDADDPLGALRWTLASLRKSLGDPELFTGNPVSVDLDEDLTVDVLELLAGRLDPPDDAILLDGVDLAVGPEFDTWLLVARQQIGARVGEALREQTLTALARGDGTRAVELAGRAVRRDPFDESAQVLLVRSLMVAGHREAARQHLEEVEALYERELGVGPTPALRSAARTTPAEDPPGVSAPAMAAGLLDSGRAALRAGATEAGIDCLRRAATVARAGGDRALAAETLAELGSSLVHAVRGFDDEGVIHLHEAAQLAAEVGDTRSLVHAVREIGYADVIAGRRPGAVRCFEEARAIADGDAGLLSAVEAYAALNESDWGHHDAAVSAFGHALETARSAGDRRWEGWVLGIGGWALLRAGDAELAAAWERDCLAVVEELHWVAFEPWAVSVHAEATAAVDGASWSEPLERSFAVSCHLDDPCWEGSLGRMLAMHHLAEERLDDAVHWIVEARRRATRRSDTWTGLYGSILLTHAELLDVAGDRPERDVVLRELIALGARAHLDDHLGRAVAMLSG